MKYQLTRERATETVGRIRQNVKEYFERSGLSYAIFGKSEGLNSSVVVGLLSGIEGLKPIGAIMPMRVGS